VSDRTPGSTYRLQLHAGFPFAAAESAVPYLARLGVTHLYLSPVLQAAPGSMHGYDVVDHSRVSDDLGGDEALRGLADTAHRNGLGIVVDVVPNHMSIPAPATLNREFWDVLRHGRDSAYAHWFDIDWDLCDGRLGLPVLGESLDAAIRDGALVVEHGDGDAVVRYRGGQVFPIADGTSNGPLAEVLARQRYLLAFWRDKDTTLGYRRFFDVDTLIAVRVELPDVFDATHRTLLDLHSDGVIDGFRIDHPDGLADPEGYLERLDRATGGAWVVVEKILAAHEALPSSWRCAGTTGYDAIEAIQAALTPPTGADLDRLWREATPDFAALADTEQSAKRLVVRRLLQPEVGRLVRRARDAATARGVDADEAALRRGFEALFAHIDAYRAYVRPGQPVPEESASRLDSWRDRAIAAEPAAEEAIRLVCALVADSTSADPTTRDLVVRFQQVCGPVMAKGVEDTTFYRFNRLLSLNEVGGDPGVLVEADPLARIDAWAGRQSRSYPSGMTTLSTHDTKRDEDVRARISVAAEDVAGWRRVCELVTAEAAARDVPADAAWLVMQTVVGGWPITEERLLGYVQKAAREAKSRTTWTEPDDAYETALADLAQTLLLPGPVHDTIVRWASELDGPAGDVDLAAKLMQLTLPGVPDVYQGCEAVSRSLVDPDNRRPVDYETRRERLRALDDGDDARNLSDRKLLVTSRALRLRRDRPQLFDESAPYRRLDTGTPHAFAFQRGDDLLTAVTRWPLTLGQRGGWSGEQLAMPRGRWRDVLGDRAFDGRPTAFADVFVDLPVALLVRETA
jgi:(1->4)-alpha-D-glucan 1-alpha-D-glucosylmutase